MAKKKKNKALTRAIKFLLALGLIYLVLNKIDIKNVYSLIISADLSYILLAFFLVVAAQTVGGLRMRYYLKKSGMIFCKIYAVGFYFIGAMFNTLVPGGIGGDGFKAYYFQKKYRFPWQKTVLTVVRGRASGLFFLFLSLIVICLFYLEKISIDNIEYILFFSLTLIFPIYIFLVKKFLNEDTKTAVGAFSYSAPVQILYIISTIAILTSIEGAEDILGYLLVFLISNIVAVIPISIGGIGIREYTFVLVAEYIGLNVGVGIAASLLLYAVYTATSMLGYIPYLLLERMDNIQKNEMDRYHHKNLF